MNKTKIHSIEGKLTSFLDDVTRWQGEYDLAAGACPSPGNETLEKVSSIFTFQALSIKEILADIRPILEDGERSENRPRPLLKKDLQNIHTMMRQIEHILKVILTCSLMPKDGPNWDYYEALFSSAEKAMTKPSTFGGRDMSLIVRDILLGPLYKDPESPFD